MADTARRPDRAWFRGSEDSARTVAAFAPSNVDLVRAGYAAFARGDIPAVLATFTETAQWYAPDELPTGGTFHGPAGIAAFFSGLPAHYDEGHHTGRVASTGFDVGFVHVWTLADGLAAAVPHGLTRPGSRAAGRAGVGPTSRVIQQALR